MTTKQLRKMHREHYNAMSFKTFIRKAYKENVLTADDLTPKVKNILGLK